MKTDKEMVKEIEAYLCKNIVAFKGEIDAFKKAFEQNPSYAIQYRAENVVHAQTMHKLCSELHAGMSSNESVVHKMETLKDALARLTLRVIEWNLGKSDSTSRAANLVDYTERESFSRFVKDLRRLSGVDFI